MLLVIGFTVIATTFVAMGGYICILHRRAKRAKKQAKTKLKNAKRNAAQCQEAVLYGASTVANQLVDTVMKRHLQDGARRETAHQQQIMQLVLLLARGQNLPNGLLADALNSSSEPMQALPLAAQTDPVPRRRGLISWAKSLFIGA